MAILAKDSDAAGKLCLQFFYNATVSNFIDSPIGQMDFTKFIAYIDSLPHVEGKPTVRQRLGEGIIWADYPMDRQRIAMEQLAAVYKGNLPTLKGSGDFLGALAEDSLSISYLVSNVGDAIADSAKDLAKYAAGGVALYAFGALAVLLLLRGK